MAPNTHLDPALRCAEDFGFAAVAVQALTPEASARRYFRLELADGSRCPWLLVQGGQAPRDCTTFLEDQGVRVPRLGDSRDNSYLVQDLGDRHLADDPSPVRYNQLLEDWMSFAFAELPESHPNHQFALDRPLFTRELRQFADSYLYDWRGLELPPEAWKSLHSQLQIGAAEAAAGPTALQHRDFHSRNLLIPDAGSPVWIDHQDLRRGPLYYDLASLLTDAYVDLPRTMVQRLWQEMLLLGRTLDLDHRQAQELFLAVAWQRLLKALGTFGKLLTAGRHSFAAMETRALEHVALLQELGTTPAWVEPLLPHLQQTEITQ